MKKGTRLDFDIYGRFRVQIVRGDDRWLMYRVRDSRRTPYFDIVIPPDMEPGDIHRFLDDMFHEGSGPGESVVRLPDRGDGH